MPSAFWCILESLRSPALVKHLTREMGHHCDPVTGDYDLAALASIPVFSSLHTEVSRLRTATVVVRVNDADRFALDSDWSIPKGMEIRLFSHDLALNTHLWAQARPGTVEKPLQVFWPERFIVPSERAQERKGDIRTGTFSTESVGALLTAFGGGPHLCPGRLLVKTIQAGTLAVLLSEYEIQLSDPESTEGILPPVPGVAYGTIKPLQPVRMRIRKRPLSKIPSAR